MTTRTPTMPVAIPAWAVPAHRPTLRGRLAALPISAEGAWVAAILVVAGIVHGVNMLGFPYYETDEGTYMAQAWAVATKGELAHYTYWYDHAPVGWMQIALWTKLTGGFHTFGSVIDSGRVLMLIVQVASTWMLYRITRSVSGSATAATVASLLFALSAYGIHYHRRVLLDNIAAVWMLAAFYPLLTGKLTLRRVWFSAAALAVSILSKEVGVFLTPVMTLLVWQRADKTNRWFAVAGWLSICASIVSLYVLLAVLKHELLPAPTLADGTKAHVSLIETLQFQASRGKDGGFKDLDSRFWEVTRMWMRDDPVLTVGGTVSAALFLVLAWWRRTLGILGLATFAFWLFLGRGGEVLDFYLVPLLPLLALNVGVVVGWVGDGVARAVSGWGRLLASGGKALRVALAVLCLSGTAAGYSSARLGLAEDPTLPWTGDPTTGQRLAVDWVERNIDPESYMIIDQSAWLDLHDRADGGPEFVNAHWYWKLDTDASVGKEFQSDWRYADYVLATPQVSRDAAQEPMPIVRGALENSTAIERFDTGDWAVEIRWVHKLQQVDASSQPMLAKTWASYRQRFISADGRVSDPKSGGATTSEGQAYALLRAVYMNDRAAFDTIWAWTQANLQVRGDGLLSWQWGTLPDGTTGILDGTSAADADADAALALLFASKRWVDPTYLAAGREIVEGIWNVETAEVAGRRIVVAGNWARGDGTADVTQPIVNPSYLAPYAYRIFAEADPDHRWGDVVDASYDALEKVQAHPDFGGPAGLIPNWVALDEVTGEPLSAQPHVEHANEFSWDASRVSQRMALDWIWFKDDRAKQVIDRLSFPRTQLEAGDPLYAAYHLDGEIYEGYEATSMYAGVLPGLLVGGHRDLALRVYADKVLNSYVDDGVAPPHWGGDPDDYFNQNIAWFACALFNGSMSNLWAGETTIQWDQVVFD